MGLVFFSMKPKLAIGPHLSQMTSKSAVSPEGKAGTRASEVSVCGKAVELWVPGYPLISRNPERLDVKAKQSR